MSRSRKKRSKYPKRAWRKSGCRGCSYCCPVARELKITRAQLMAEVEPFQVHKTIKRQEC